MDIQTIQDQFNTIIEGSQGFQCTSTMTTTIFDTWKQNKQRFINWFGEQLIYEFGEVEFHIDKEKQGAMVDDFLDQCSHIMKYDEYSKFYQFVKSNKESFFKNLVSNIAITYDKPINKGMKLSKAFKFFIEDKDMLIHIQQLASSYIQKDRVHGKLCFSVHPLDYLSASETTYNWRSCHALDGEYRAGNLSYMTDETTICCYIKGDEEVVLPNFPESVKWNSKKWRMWVHISEDWNYCFLGRQYPFTLAGIPEMIREKLPGSHWDNFTDYQIDEVHDPKDGSNFVLDGSWILLRHYNDYGLYNTKEVIIEGSKLNYNDLLYSSYYKPYYSSKWGRANEWNPPKIVIGHPVKCLCCGQRLISPGEGLMTCDRCADELGLSDNRVVCACCGEAYDEDDIIYLNDGTPICNDCINNGDYCYCENCGEWFYCDDGEYSEKYQNWFCRGCFEEIANEEIRYRRANHLYGED